MPPKGSVDLIGNRHGRRVALSVEIAARYSCGTDGVEADGVEAGGVEADGVPVCSLSSVDESGIRRVTELD